MAKVTKAQMVNTIKEVNKEFAMDPQLKTTGTMATLEEVIKTEIIPEIQEGDKFSKEAQSVIDYVKGKEAEEAPAKSEKKGKKDKKAKAEKEEPKAEKKAKKDKKGKKAAKAEKPAKEEPKAEKPAKSEKKAKKEAAPKAAKAGKDDKLFMELKNAKSIKKDELLKMVKTMPEFKAKKKELKKVTSVFSLKKQMQDMLDVSDELRNPVKKAPAKKAPAKKKAVKESPIVKEIKGAKKFKALKAIVKANADKFPKLKVKKFDDVEKLRTAMLELVTPKGKTKKAKKNLPSRIGVVTECIVDSKKDETVESIVERADKIYMKATGKDSNKTETKFCYYHAKKVIETLDKLKK